MIMVPREAYCYALSKVKGINFGTMNCSLVICSVLFQTLFTDVPTQSIPLKIQTAIKTLLRIVVEVEVKHKGSI